MKQVFLINNYMDAIKSLPDESFDLVLGFSTFTLIGWDEFYKEALRLIKNGGAIITKHGDIYSRLCNSHTWVRKRVIENGLEFLDSDTYYLNSYAKHYTPVTEREWREYVKEDTRYSRQGSGNSGRHQIIDFVAGLSARERQQDSFEPPIGLYKYLIQSYVPAGGTVLDIFGVSGNSAIAAYQAGMDTMVSVNASLYEFQAGIEKFREHVQDGAEIYFH